MAKYRLTIFSIWFVLGMNAIPSFTAEPLGSSPQDELTPYILILTGTELLTGVYQDAHTQFITKSLGPLGCRCLMAISIGDLREEMLDALKFASQKANLIIMTGGLGPTDADITREVLTEFTQIPVQENPEVEENLKKRMNSTQLRPNMREQTFTPEKGTYFPNPNGTAVGLVFERENQVIVAMPGPPRELQPMLQEQLVPYLSKKFGTHTVGCSLMMRFAGIGESNIDHVMHNNMTLPSDLIIAFQFSNNRVDLTFSFPGDTEADRARLRALRDELAKHIGDSMYSDDGSTLEEVVLKRLAEKNTTLATIEVGSGGIIAASLNSSELAEQCYRGGHVAPSHETLIHMLALKQEDIASQSQEELSKFFAQKICEQESTEWALSVSDTFIDENDKSRYVWLALGSKIGGFEARKIAYRGNGDSARQRFVTEVLDLLRKKLAQG